jgi:hypothetical protein
MSSSDPTEPGGTPNICRLLRNIFPTLFLSFQRLQRQKPNLDFQFYVLRSSRLAINSI